MLCDLAPIWKHEIRGLWSTNLLLALMKVP